MTIYKIYSPEKQAYYVVTVDRKISQKKIERVFHEIIKTAQLEQQQTVKIDNKEVHLVISAATRKEFLQSADHLVPEQLSFLERIVKCFRNFIAWMTGAPPQMQNLELAFNMHLFRNADTSLFPILTSSKNDPISQFTSTQVQFSDVLKIWSDFIDQLFPYLTAEEREGLAELREELKDLADMQAEIEQVRSIRNLEKRVKETEKLNQAFQKKVEARLGAGKKAYLPGGFIDPTTGAVVNMVYELKKEGEQLVLRAIDISETLFKEEKTGGVIPSHIWNIHLSLDKLIYNTNQAQIGPPHLLNKQFSKWEAVKMLISGMEEQDEYSESRKALVQTILPSRETVQQKDMKTTRPRKLPDPEKLMEVFLKTTKPHLYSGLKSMMKITALLSVYEQSKVHLSDAKFRSWMKANAQNLIESLDKKGMDDLTDAAYLKERLKAILNHIQEIDSMQPVQLPVSPDDQKSHPSSFSEPLTIPTFAPLAEIKETAVTVTVMDPLKNIALWDLGALGVKEQFNSWIHRFRNLAKKGDFTALEYGLTDAYEILQTGYDKNFFKNLDKEEAEEWSAIVKNLGFIAAQCHYGKGYTAPEPQYIHFMLQSLMITDQLTRKHVSEFGMYQFDTAPFQQVLLDPYLSLGIWGPHIAYDLSKLQKYQRSIRLTSGSDHEKRFEFHDNTFLALLTTDPKQVARLREDIGQHQLLPPLLLDMRQLYCLTQAMLAPTRTFIPQSLVDLASTGLEVLETENGRPSLFHAANKLVLQKIASTHGEIRFTAAKNKFGYGTQFVIEPWNLAIQDFDDPMEGFDAARFEEKLPQIYDKNGIPIEDSGIKKHLFEQRIAQVTDDHVGEDGLSSMTDSWHTRYRDYGIEGKTQQNLLADPYLIPGLPSEVSKELQWMQTGPNTIIPETLGKLKKYAALLNDEKIGPALYRLFDRNFFQNYRLYAYLSNNPDFAPILIQELNALAIEMKEAGNIQSYLYLLTLMEKTAIIFDAPKMKISKEAYQPLLEERRAEEKKLMKSSNAGAPHLTRYQRDLNEQFLFAKACQEEQIDDDTLKEVLRSYFSLQKTPSSSTKNDADKRFTIGYWMHKLQPRIRYLVSDEKQKHTLCNQLLQDLGYEKQDLVWTAADKSDLLFKSGKFLIDLRAGQIWTDKKQQVLLPQEMKMHGLFSDMKQMLQESGFEENLEEIQTIMTAVSYKETNGRQYAFNLSQNGKKSAFRLILTADGTLRLYRKIAKRLGGEWYQWQPTLSPQEGVVAKKPGGLKGLLSSTEQRTKFPRKLEDDVCWVRADGKVLRTEKQGKVIYQGKIKGAAHTLSSLKEIASGKELLNVWSDPAFNHFQAIEDPSEITVTGKSGKAENIEYHRFNLSYQWNARKQLWECEQYPGHFLTGGTLNQRFRGTLYQGESVPPYDVSPLKSLFPGTFIDYHFLEQAHGWPKVVMAMNAYQPTDPEKDKLVLHLQKHAKRQIPDFAAGTAEKKARFVFTADPNKGLVAEDVPEGYLYLAYVLLSQGQYAEAIRYLKKADINRPFSEDASQILGWMHQACSKDDSAESKAFQVQLLMLQIRHEAFLNPKAGQTERGQRLAFTLAKAYQTYQAKKESVPLNLRLTDAEQIELKRYCETSLYYVADKLFTHQKECQDLMQFIQYYCLAVNPIPDLAGMDQFFGAMPDYQKARHLFFDEMHLTLEEVVTWSVTGVIERILKAAQSPDTPEAIELIKQIVSQENTSLARLKISLQQEIQQIDQKIAVREAAIQTAKNKRMEVLKQQPSVETPLFDTDTAKFFEIFPASASQQTDWQSRRDNFTHQVTHTADDYSQQMGKEMAEDLQQYLTAQEGLAADRHVCQPKNVDALMNVLRKERFQYVLSAREHRLNVLTMLPQEAAINAEKWSSLLEEVRRKNQNWKEVMFDTALRCFGENDWTALKALYPNENAFLAIKLSLEDELRAYLKDAIRAKIRERAEKVAIELEGIHPKTQRNDYLRKSEELYALTQLHWSYDPDKDVDSPTLLLIEYDLDLIVRPSQIEVIRSAITTPNQFKQEICGGGKTTVLRNIIAHLRADGTVLSTISTLEPLRQTHGLLFSRTTLHAFGQKSLEFKFNRKTPSDEASLLKLHRNLLRVIDERGRLDLTKGDLLSFRLAKKLKQEEIFKLRKSNSQSTQIAELHREIDVMENIEDLLRLRAQINADELDKDCDPTQEKNYAYGERGGLNGVKINAALELFETILTAEDPALVTLAQAICWNQQSDLTKTEIEAALQALGTKLFEAHKGTLGLDAEDKEIFVAYITEINPKNLPILELYNNHISPTGPEKSKKRKIQEQICFAHEFLVDILPHAAGKKGGVKFGRSDDLVHVIPFEGSDKPKTGSEHGLESEQIWYTCLDYADRSRKGIAEEQMAQLVLTAQKKALSQISEYKKSHPEGTLEYSKTAAAKDFEQFFNLPLEMIQPKHYALMAQRIHQSPQALKEFLKSWVFPEYRMSTEKIVSNSQDPPSMVARYSGSAGTDSARYTIPDPIDASDVRQPGVHGEVIKSLLEIESRNQNEGIDSFVVYQKETLIDQLAEKMQGGDCLSDVGTAFPGIPAEEIARQIAAKKPGIVIRFMNRNDEWKMLKESKIIDIDPSIPLQKTITIFDDVHTRGAERPSMDNVTEFVTIDAKTEWTKYEQGVLRERGVTKGKARVVHFITDEVHKQLKQPTVSSLCALLYENESASLKTLNYKAEKQKIEAIGRHASEEAARAMSRESRKQGLHNHWEAREYMYANTRFYTVKKTESKPEKAGTPHGMLDADTALNEVIKEEKKNVQTVMTTASAAPESLAPYMRTFAETFSLAEQKLSAKESSEAKNAHKPRLPTQLLPPQVSQRSEMDNEQSVEQEQEQELQIEQEQEIEKEKSTIPAARRHEIGHFALNLQHANLDDLFFKRKYDTKFRFCNDTHWHLPRQKFFTENFAQILSGGPFQPWQAVPFGPEPLSHHDQYFITRTLFIVKKGIEAEPVVEIIPSLMDLDLEIEPYVRERAKNAWEQGFLLAIYNYDLDVVDCGISFTELQTLPNGIALAKGIVKQIVSTKLQNGDVSFPSMPKQGNMVENILHDQWGALVEYLVQLHQKEFDLMPRRGKVDIRALESEFKKFIHQYRPSHIYEGSDLERAFKEAKLRLALI